MPDPEHGQLPLTNSAVSTFHWQTGFLFPSCQTSGKPGATLWFNDKGTLGSRIAPVIKENPELNFAPFRIGPGWGWGMAGPVSTSFLVLVSMQTGRVGSTSHHPYPTGPEDQVGFGLMCHIFKALCLGGKYSCYLKTNK